MTTLEVVFLGVAVGSQVIGYLCTRQTRQMRKMLSVAQGAGAPDWERWYKSNARWRARAIRAERREFGAVMNTLALLDYVNFPEEES